MVQLNVEKHFSLNQCVVFSQMNPASSTFGWMGVEKSKLIFLNDLRWALRGIQGGNIDWQVFLNLLEGQTVSLPAPMNTNFSHIKLTKLMPIFATSIDEVQYWEKTVSETQTPRHIGENFMMAQRWNNFRFSYKILQEEKRDIPDCKVCFSKFLLQKEN